MTGEKGVSKNLTMPFALVLVAAIGAGATEGARHFRFSDPSIAAVCDCLSAASIGVVFLFIAKINLARIPQHQNLAIFAAVVSGLFFAEIIGKVFSLLLK